MLAIVARAAREGRGWAGAMVRRAPGGLPLGTPCSARLLCTHGSPGIAIIPIPHRARFPDEVTPDCVAQLQEALQRAQEDADVRSIVLSSGTEHAFAPSLPTSLLPNGPALVSFMARARELTDMIETSRKPVVAAINGQCSGFGMAVALACHYRVAADGAAFSLPEVAAGIIPAAGTLRRLSRAIDMGAALPLVVRGRSLDSQRAFQLGLLHMLADRFTLHSAAQHAAWELAHAISRPATSASLTTASARARQQEFGRVVLPSLARVSPATLRRLQAWAQATQRLWQQLYPRLVIATRGATLRLALERRALARRRPVAQYPAHHAALSVLQQADRSHALAGPRASTLEGFGRIEDEALQRLGACSAGAHCALCMRGVR